jgi:hypothetical protein
MWHILFPPHKSDSTITQLKNICHVFNFMEMNKQCCIKPRWPRQTALLCDRMIGT